MTDRNLFYPVIIFAALLLVGCGGNVDDQANDDQLTKAEIAAGAVDGKADHPDWCETFGWYGDGICDTFCHEPDPDCDATYDPCGGLTCGETCSLCPPDDDDCFETAVVKTCQPDGSCAATAPDCDGDDDGGDDGYDPCEGLACGASCTQCPPNDPDCVETATAKMCQPDGSCAATAPDCGGDGDGDDDAYDPCEGLSCGEMCTLCDPNDSDCVETAVVKACQPDGSCAATSPVCGGDDDETYDPCEGKVCGETCTVCDPSDPDCFESLEVKECDGNGICTSSTGVTCN